METKYDKIDETLLAAYLRNETTSEENSRVEEWMATSEENRRQAEDLYYMLFTYDRMTAYESVDLDRSYAQLTRRIHKRRFGMLRRHAAAIASMAALVAVAIVSLVLVGNISDRLATPLVVATDMGERSHVTLPDGTKVWMNSCSRLEYSAAYFSSERRVKLSGEAYFEVAKDTSTPFIVHSNGLRTKVLGTRFNIRANDNDHFVTETLFEGSVHVSSASADTKSRCGITMRPAQQLVFNTITGSMTLSDCADTQQALCWVEGRLHFEQTPLQEIVRELERHYNITISILDPSLGDERFTAEFRSADGIYEILSVLRLTGKFSYRTSNNRIEIFSQGERP